METNTNTRDCIACSLVWLLCIVALVLLGVKEGWNFTLKALLPLMAFTDLVIWLGFSLLRLPCGFTEWVCYPLWPCPFLYHGVHMRWGVIVRIVEIVVLLISGHWLWETIKTLVK